VRQSREECLGPPPCLTPGYLSAVRDVPPYYPYPPLIRPRLSGGVSDFRQMAADVGGVGFFCIKGQRLPTYDLARGAPRRASVCLPADEQTLVPPPPAVKNKKGKTCAICANLRIKKKPQDTLLRARTPALPTLCSPFHQKHTIFALPCHEPITFMHTSALDSMCPLPVY
jgi:hypothetical protein